MREHFGLLPALTSSRTVGGQSSAGSAGPFQAAASGHWSSRPRLLAGLRCKHYRARLCPGSPLKGTINYPAAPCLCAARLLHYKVLASLRCGSGLAKTHVWGWLTCLASLGPASGFLGCCWEEGSGGGPGQEEELFSQSLFGLPLAVLWDDSTACAWCLSAFPSDPVLIEVHFQSALMRVRVFYVTCGLTFQSFAVFFCFLFKLSNHMWISHPWKCLRPEFMWNLI